MKSLWMLLQPVIGLKILLAGDQDPRSKPYFDLIASFLSEQGHTVFHLSNELQPIFKRRKSNSLFLYGVGTQYTFDWDPTLSELDN